MFRLAAVVAAVTVMATAVVAQTDVVAERKSVMRESGKYFYGALPRMLRGEAPYDQATVDAAFTAFADSAKKIPGLYPESSKNAPRTSDYSASPKIWENKADFEAKVAAYGKSIEAARPKATSLDGLKEAHALVRAGCDSCHDSYRVRH
ncbi:MAG: cytochrome c [Bradyrhizobiaceae bacterium]|nr:cytochrome c [Bradyrhizobiaceae bacterium]